MAAKRPSSLPISATTAPPAPTTSDTDALGLQLDRAALLTDLAATNRVLVSAGLAPIPSPATESVAALLTHVRTSLAAQSAANVAQATAATTHLTRKLKAARSAASLADAAKKEADDRERAIKDLARKLAVTEAALDSSRKRCSDLEKEIWQVRRDFAVQNPAQNHHVLARKSSTNLKQAYTVQRPLSRTASNSIRASIAPQPESPVPTESATPIVDAELEEAQIARKAAEIARRHAASFSYDTSSLQTAQMAAGKATLMAESVLASHSIIAPPASTTPSIPSSVVPISYASVASSGLTSTESKDTVTPAAENPETDSACSQAMDDLVGEYTKILERKPMTPRRLRRSTRANIMTRNEDELVSSAEKAEVIAEEAEE
ncbi:hypothetical protein HDU79_010486 [Rhizoclosmatium sp. JEL0117]|nr:hypothetical protein HDU79_010486 [Rhizoclosmatium sp. JEL0117]